MLNALLTQQSCSRLSCSRLSCSGQCVWKVLNLTQRCPRQCSVSIISTVHWTGRGPALYLYQVNSYNIVFPSIWILFFIFTFLHHLVYWFICDPPRDLSWPGSDLQCGPRGWNGQWNVNRQHIFFKCSVEFRAVPANVLAVHKVIIM